jgi:Fe-S cluster assembly ATP-binding protein
MFLRVIKRRRSGMLELRHISFAVNDTEEKEIVKDLSLTVENGKFVVITGPNGGGKSTMAKLIAGIEKPSEGRIFLDGEDITDLNVTERAQRGIGYAFQQPVRFKGIRVFDLLKIASGQSISMKEACSYLSEVGLCAKDYIEREVNASLSGGELKRIEIATVLARKTKLSVFDEPEAGIDLWSFQNLVRIFEKLQKETQDSSILVISHQERILEIADEIIVLSGGTVEQMGTRNEILPKILGTEAAASSCARLSDRRD